MPQYRVTFYRNVTERLSTTVEVEAANIESAALAGLQEIARDGVDWRATQEPRHEIDRDATRVAEIVGQPCPPLAISMEPPASQ